MILQEVPALLKKSLAPPASPHPPLKGQLKIGLASPPKLEEAPDSSLETEEPLNSAAGGVQDSNNEHSTPYQSPTSSATHISKSPVPVPVPSPAYDNSLEGESVSPLETIHDPCESYPSPPTPSTGSGPTPINQSAQSLRLIYKKRQLQSICPREILVLIPKLKRTSFKSHTYIGP